MYLNSMSEFKTIHTLLSFLPPSSCDLSPLHKRTQLSPCLMLANPPALSQLLLVFILPLYPDFASKSVLGFKSPLVVVQRSFPPPISAMPSISSPLKGQKMLSRSPNIINQPLSPSTTCLHLKKAGMKAVVKTKHPLLSARHRKVHLDFAHAHKDWTLDG